MSQLNASQLSIEQVNSIKENLQQELEHLTESFAQLRQAQTKFADCTQSIQTVSQQCSEGKQVLVPLTTSLYVPGKVVSPNKFIVDVGTDYFVEKNPEQAVKFFDDKVATLDKNLVDLDKLVNDKVAALQAMERVLLQKVQEAQKKPATSA